MYKNLFTGAFFLGALAVVWVGAGFVNSPGLALVMTAIIAAVYGFGAHELRQFRQATSTLSAALAAIPESLSNLGDWLDKVHPSLQNPVRLRIEGERIGLPGPALTPYLVGLLVMLGMLGTFLGMVVSLNGAAFSLEGTTDLQAIRAALAAPIKGLGLAFGTSVAGVAASAMLGLMSAISRRERMLVAQRLDTRIATVLRGFSLTHQRQEAYQALQSQARALPVVVDQLQAMMVQMERLSQQVNDRLLSNQISFQNEVKDVYTGLATSVDQSLRASLTQSAQLAAEGIKPVFEAAMMGMAQEASLQHQRMTDTAQMQLDGLSAKLGVTVATVTEMWTAALASHEKASASLQADQALRDQKRQATWMESLETMAATLQREWQQAGAQTHAQQQLVCTTLASTAQQISEQAQAGVSLLHHEFGALREQEEQRGKAAVERLGDLQTALTQHLTTLGRALEDPITRLIEIASEAPRAAADVIGQMRQEMSNSIARDKELLAERSRIMATLNALLDATHQASVEQRAAIDALVASAAVALKHTGSQFAEQVGTEAARLADIATHVTRNAAEVASSAIEVASLGETFGFAVKSFNEANEKLIGNLERIEGALDKSMARSDDQLAYYVAQAREIIDLSLMSQKEIFEELRQFPARQALSAEEVI
ncbi:DUF802 domain-containing protein [Rhodoferax sp.]|uniref:DUF802 domain-containing protein n=1 Tax=Rhodoferax sp. TaxID=50421 RepID=UPI0026287D42|nr:DUF802 domain-containing protein [Rhodoferax sp.]MDD3935197.1 hypothetical protein [Rhodoferax sp.]